MMSTRRAITEDKFVHISMAAKLKNTSRFSITKSVKQSFSILKLYKKLNHLHTKYLVKPSLLRSKKVLVAFEVSIDFGIKCSLHNCSDYIN